MESRARWEGDRVPPGLLRLSVGLEDAETPSGPTSRPPSAGLRLGPRACGSIGRLAYASPRLMALRHGGCFPSSTLRLAQTTDSRFPGTLPRNTEVPSRRRTGPSERQGDDAVAVGHESDAGRQAAAQADGQTRQRRGTPRRRRRRRRVPRTSSSSCSPRSSAARDGDFHAPAPRRAARASARELAAPSTSSPTGARRSARRSSASAASIGREGRLTERGDARPPRRRLGRDDRRAQHADRRPRPPDHRGRARDRRRRRRRPLAEDAARRSRGSPSRASSAASARP